LKKQKQLTFSGLLPGRRYVLSTNEAAVLFVLQHGEMTTAQIRIAVANLRHGGNAAVQTQNALPALEAMGLILTVEKSMGYSPLRVHSLTPKGKATLTTLLALLKEMGSGDT
jgi:hypothetical protein